MKKLIILVTLIIGINGVSMAGCDVCTGGGVGVIDPYPIGGEGPTPIGGDDVHHVAEILYFRTAYYFRTPVVGRNLADCRAQLAAIANDPHNIVVQVTKPCTPAY